MTSPEAQPITERLRAGIPGGPALVPIPLTALGLPTALTAPVPPPHPWTAVPCAPGAVERRLPLGVRNFETEHLNVNELDGNPIAIAASVVWKGVDTGEASFSVADYHDYVRVQSESAVRNLATHYPYDSHDEAVPSLRGHTQVVADKLRQEIHDRLDKAGVQVLEARISHLAYAQEIAEAMLRRQQAGAVIAARRLIVDGAVGMVEMALERLEAKKMVDLGPEQKAAMVSNLLVVLCSEHSAAPVVNAGTLYQ